MKSKCKYTVSAKGRLLMVDVTDQISHEHERKISSLVGLCQQTTKT